MTEVMTGAQAIVQCIRNENVRHVFCVPGESYLDILDAMYGLPDLQLISTRHEGGAAFAAEAYAKATGNVSVAMATRGVGATNLSIGIHTAYQDSTPMVVFLGQVKSKFRGREGFQEIDLDRFFQHICKWTVEIRDVERIPELVQRAFRVAQSGRPGPVVVSVPEDILKQTAEMRFAGKPARTRPKPIEEELNQCLNMIQQAERPLIIAGGGVKLSHAEEELLKFADSLSVPVLASFRRHDVFPNDHQLYLGHLGIGTFDGIVEHVKQADLIIALGTRLSEITTQSYSLIKPEHKLIHCDIEADIIGRVYSPDLALIGDMKATLQALNVLIKEKHIQAGSWKDWAEGRREVYEQITSLEQITTEDDEIEVKEIIRVLQDNLPKDAILTNDAGNFSAWLHSYYQFTKPKTYIGPTSGAMGYGFPAAVGAKFAHPDRVVVSLSGDGGFMMTMSELETAVRFNLPIIAIVFNNNMYGTIRMHQEKHFPYRVIGTDLGNPDFVKLAESMGAYGLRVTKNEEFQDCLQAALNYDKGPSVIEVVCSPEKISVRSTIQQLRKTAKV